MQWSTFQQNIFTFFDEQPQRNFIVNSCPGSGKSATARQLCLQTGEEMLYLAFNKAIVEDFKSKVSRGGLSVDTFNAYGHRMLFQRYGKKLHINRFKVHDIIDDLYKGFFKAMGHKYGPTAKQDLAHLVRLAKGSVALEATAIVQLQEMYDIKGYAGIVQHTLAVLEENVQQLPEIDFDDQLLLPVQLQLQTFPVREVVIDEAQDMNPAKMKLIQAIVQQHKARVGFIGDKHQAIYGFTGACYNSMEQLQQQFDCVELPLTLSYRCPKLVVAEAQKFFPEDIAALDDAPEGLVREMKNGEEYSVFTLVLCRLNAPLVQKAYELLRQRIPVRIEGREFGRNLLRFIKQLDGNTVQSMLKSLDEWYAWEAAQAQGKGLRDEALQEKLAQLGDKAQTVRAFADMAESNSLEVLYSTVDNLFEQDYGVLLSSMHRAKGLEAKKVVLLKWELCPSPWAKTVEQKLQERNLQYVAVTRSLDELVYG